MTTAERAELQAMLDNIAKQKEQDSANYHSATGGHGVGGLLTNVAMGWGSMAETITGGRVASGTNEASAQEAKNFVERQKAQEELLKRIADTLASGIKVQDVTAQAPGVDKSGQMPANSPAGPPKK